MSERLSKALLAAEAVLLLLPLTLHTALFVPVAYPAYPPPNSRPIQVVFGLALLLQVLALVAARRLALLFLHSGRRGLGRAGNAWRVLRGLGATVGLAGMLATAEHLLDPGTVRNRVGFALLMPAAVLWMPGIHLLLEGRASAPAPR